MKRMIMLLALSVSFLAVSLLSAHNSQVRVTLAQPTVVGEATLPAGEYTVLVSRTTGDIPLLIFQGKDKAAMVLATQSSSFNSRSDSTELVLNKTGDQFKLFKVIVEGVTFEVAQ